MESASSALTPVPLGALPLARLAQVLPAPEYARLEAGAREVVGLMSGRVLWNVNSTARGGGVAEMLRPLLSYARGVGVDAHWSVLNADAAFFTLTKTLHNRLHGLATDEDLSADDHRLYDRVCAAAAGQLTSLLAPGDVVILHDPQTAGMIPVLARTGVPVLWRCHIGIDSANDIARSAIDFLLPYVAQATRTIFSREAYIWQGVDHGRARIIRPSIDAFAPKNEELPPDVVTSILVTAGVIDGEAVAAPVFTRTDGSPGRVDAAGSMVEDERLGPGDRFVLQVSRWDRLKDPVGVMAGFAMDAAAASRCHLVLAGPAPTAIQDDPEGAEVLEEVSRSRLALPPEQRRRVHLALLPMDDPEVNAVVVNALQRAAAIVVQKSLAEGFGLTVAEAMWKARPVVASAVGGILDQIEDGVTGLLVDPADLAGFAAAIERLLGDPDFAERMGVAARERVRSDFLSSRHLLEYLALLQEVVT